MRKNSRIPVKDAAEPYTMYMRPHNDPARTRFLKILAVAALCLLLLILIARACGQEQMPTPEPIAPNGNVRFESDADIMLTMFEHETERMAQIDLETYTMGVLSAEMPMRFEFEALKAQAVAARTLAIENLSAFGGSGSSAHPGADVCDSSRHDQAYDNIDARREKWGGNFDEFEQKLTLAVDETHGEILYYDGEPIEVFFHSTSGGYTEPSENVFSAALPYYQTVHSPGEEEADHYTDTQSVSRSKFVETINEAYPEAELSKGSLKKDIKEPVRFESGRVETIGIGGVRLTGREVRSLFGLYSANFTIELTEDDVVFTTKGFGHGVGMSQYGANAMAEEGKTYDEILSYYYVNTTLGKIAAN